MNRLGIFGGSFDPPHVGHLKVALQAAVELGLDQILWIPASYSPHKSAQETLSPAMRLDMVRLIVGLDSRFQVDTRELTRTGPSYTVDTLESLKGDFPDASLYLIVGEDSYRSFSTWKHPDRIRKMAHLVVYKRTSDASETSRLSISPSDHLLAGDPVDITSTDIRARMSKNIRTDHLLTPEVSDFIKANGLYLSV